MKKPAVITVVHVDTTGLQDARWRYCIMSDLVERVCILRWFEVLEFNLVDYFVGVTSAC